MKYLKLFFKKRKGLLAVTLALLVGQVVGTLMIPRLVAEIVDKGILAGNMAAIYRVGAQMLLVSLTTSIVAITGSFFASELSNAFGRDMREAIFRKSQALSLEQVNEVGISSMMTRSTSDISSLQQTLIMILQLIVPAPMIIAVCMVMTLQISPLLTLIPMGCIVLFTVLGAMVLKKSHPLSKAIQSKMDRINQMVRESVTGIRVIRAFDNGGYEKERSDRAFLAYADHMIRLNKLFAVLNPAVWLVMGLSMAVILYKGGMLSAEGRMQIGEITAVTEYTIMTLSYVILAVMSCVTLPKMRACLMRLTEVLDKEPDILDPSVPIETAAYEATDPAVPVIEFSHVNFAYPGAEEPVIRDLSFTCKMGQTTAIIGSTGSGKSTIANLLLRLHEINDGQILLFGQNVKSMPQHRLRNLIGYTPQKAVLFSGTIKDNLCMGKQDADEAQMWQALKIAQAEVFVKGLKGGLSALVSQNGSNFSGGQKQRLSIARAVIKNTPVLVFDDSFSALDLKTDAMLRRALKEHTANTAKIIIAQRVQTIADADQIIVLDEGRIAGLGTHAYLMESCEIYQDIAKSQLSSEEVA